MSTQSLNAQTYINEEWINIHGAPDTLEWSASTINEWGLFTTGNKINQGQQADIYTIMHNEEGNIIWEKTWNGPQNSTDYGTSITTDEMGNVFVAGASHYINDSVFNIVLLKYDMEGSLIFQTNFEGSGKNSFPVAITLDSNNYIYITGASENDTTGLDYITLKFNQNGQIQWGKTYDFNYGVDIAADIVVDEDGETIAVTGGSETSNGEWDYTTVLYNSSGDQIGVDREPSAESNIRKPKYLVRDSERNYYLTGVELNNNYDIKVIKLDSTLLTEWVQLYDGGTNVGSNVIQIDDHGNVYVGGWIEEAPLMKNF